MAAHDLTLALVHGPENVCYLSGHETPGYYVYQCLLVPAVGDPVLLMRETETVNARAFSYLADVQGYADTVDPIDATRQAIRDRGFDLSTVGIEDRCWFLPPALHARLVAELGVHQPVAIDAPLGQLRLIKSEREIAGIREAARITSAAMTVALGAVAVGASEREVAAAIFSRLMLEGSEYLAMEPFVASGPRSGTIHASWSERRIGANEPVLIEIAACTKRYHAALMRTAATGPLPAQAQALADICLAALTAALAEIRPGNTPEAIDRACKATIADAGLLDCYRKRTGYSIGLGFAPDWGEGHVLSLRAGETTPLAPGMVLHVVPALRIAGVGGVGVSETVLVTPTGHEVLTDVSRRITLQTG